MHAPRTFYYHELYSQVGKANWLNKLHFFSKLYSHIRKANWLNKLYFFSKLYSQLAFKK